jgi:hypothetical protein
MDNLFIFFFRDIKTRLIDSNPEAATGGQNKSQGDSIKVGAPQTANNGCC